MHQLATYWALCYQLNSKVEGSMTSKGKFYLGQRGTKVRREEEQQARAEQKA